MGDLKDIFKPSLDEKNVMELNPIALAFVGDGVHTMYVRDKVIKESNLLVNDYHKRCASFCNANAQARELDRIFPLLNEREQDLVRRTRNAKIHHTAKHSDEATYKKATCYEALLGYLYLLGDYDRIIELLKVEV